MKSPEQLKFFNLLTPRAFWQQHISGHFGDFQARYGLNKLQSTKSHLQHHSMSFLPLTLCFMTLLVGHVQKSKFQVFGQESDLCL